MTTMPPTPTSGRTLILTRHAKAEHVQGKPDHERELTPRGWRDARAIGMWLIDPARNVVLDLVLCSTSERTRQTLEAIRAGGASVKEVWFDPRIYDASASQLLDVLREIPDSANTVLMIGHAPGLPVLATALARDDAGATDIVDRISREFPTAAMAVLAYEGRWEDLAPETAHVRDFVVSRG